MVALVSKETDLRRVGTRWTGLCPFHEERTPSFSVNAEEKLFHCFGCQKGGDAIGFVMETEGLDFPEAVEALAERFGVELKREREDPRGGGAAQAPRAPAGPAGAHHGLLLHVSLGRARGRPGARLPRRPRAGGGGAARVPRGLRAQGVGPRAHRRPPGRLHRGRAAGLRAWRSRARNGNLLDRFRERIMFPLADNRGRVLGFGARAMRDEQGAKYINTAENEIYKKGRQLFGIDRARAAIAKAGPRRGGGGLHRRARAPRRRRRGGRGHHGHRRDPGPDRRARARAWAPTAGSRWRSTPTARARRRCCAPRGSRGSATCSCAWSGCPRAGSRGPGAGTRGPRPCATGSPIRCLCLSSR